MTGQGAEGLERPHRHLSTSQAQAENEGVPETTTKARSGSTDQGKVNKFNKDYLESGHPRHVDGPTPSSTASTPSPSNEAPTQPQTVVRSGGSVSQIQSVSQNYQSAQRTERKRPEPPVTKGTLSELDVSKIIHNPKLRHDINFDPELHFRPNLDGEKGRRKQHKANEFWNTMERQIEDSINENTRLRFLEECGPGKDWSLPELLRAVKEIIQTLVPARDRSYLDEGLNVELIMQQFFQGVADLEKLASWLSCVLKSHCAPMRDEWVDEMYRQLSAGNQEGDMHKLVTGMRSLLNVLEAMKLDVANHQIRCLRPVLIEDTVNFEQKFFLKKMNMGRVNRNNVRSWYRHAELDLAGSEEVQSTQSSFGDMTVFMNALVRLILPSVPVSNVPNTFLFDEERILKLRSDLLDAINLDICMRMYEDYERLSPLKLVSRLHETVEMEADAAASSGFNFNAPISRPSSGIFNTSSSRPGSGIFSSATSTCSSSPRSSGCLFSQPALPLADVRSKSAMVYNSLVALVQTAPHSRSQTEKWAALAPEMALQIMRFTDVPQDMLPIIESRLMPQLTDVSNMTYLEVESTYSHRLLNHLASRVKELGGVSLVNLFSVATTRSASGSMRSSSHEESLRDESTLEDMAVRLAHLGILHWRVWAPIAYVEPDSAMEMEPSNTTSP